MNIDYIDEVLSGSAAAMKSLTEIYAELMTAQGLSPWEVAKRVAVLRDGQDADPNRYHNAVKRAIADMDAAGFPMIRDCFQVCGVNIVVAIAIAASSAQS